MIAKEKIKPRLFQKLGSTFIAGLLAALPLAFTVIFIVWFADFIHRFLGPQSAFGKILGSLGLKFVTSEFTAYTIGLLITIITIYLLGVFVQAGMKYRWQAMVDNLFNSIPLVRNVYNALNKLMQMFDQEQQTEIKSMTAVMCHFGGKKEVRSFWRC